MSISREELETQGIFIPSEVNDELLARFMVGSLICLDLELVDPMCDKWRLPTLFQISDKNNVHDRDFKNFIFRFVLDNEFSDEGLYYKDSGELKVLWHPNLDYFNKILECLKKSY